MDFQRVISDVTENFKPQYDHTALEDEDLLVLYSIYTVWGCQAVVRILSIKDPVSLTNETAKKVSGVFHNPTPENLAWLYTIHPDTRPLEFLVKLRLEHRHILKELDRRHRSFKVGHAFIAMEQGQWRPKNVAEIHRLLKVENLLSYRSGKEDAEDLKSESTMGAVRFFKGRQKTLAVKLQPLEAPMPSLPQGLGLSPSDPHPWGLWHRYQLDIYIENLIRDYLSLFFGGVDRVKGASRQAFRNHVEKWEAQKRVGQEVPLEEAEKAREGREDDNAPDISADMFAVLREAKKHPRWGNKAIMVFKYYCEGKTEEEATKLAGITVKTFQNYITRLEKILAPKK